VKREKRKDKREKIIIQWPWDGLFEMIGDYLAIDFWKNLPPSPLFQI
jgi:hypothetical protein